MSNSNSALTDQQVRRLAALSDAPTRWEVILVVPGQPDRLIGYTQYQTRQGLLTAARGCGIRIRSVLGVPAWTVEWWRGQQLSYGTTGAGIEFGRTQRQAIVGGECPRLTRDDEGRAEAA